MKSTFFALAASLASLSAIVATASPAHAAVCDVTGCNTQIQAASGVVVNDIFKDAAGKTAQMLPVFGKLVDQWPGCGGTIDFAGAGHSISPFDCPGEYVGDGASATVASANTFLGSVDRQWWQPCRLNDGSLHDIGGGVMCPTSWACIADGTGGNYNPWEGLVFDLGGPSNKVAIFAENDHGPQPCESLEYTVFLSDNPNAREQILDPKKTGVDPTKWNRAVLSKIYTQGWTAVRPPDPAGRGPTCGDTAQFSVEEDSFVQVFQMPCGITFRYAAVVAGNDGLDFPACAYDSNEGEIDAVAGLTESGNAVCPDNDGDHYVDCACPGAPSVCDCNDVDPTIHPGAPEACDSLDKNCDGKPGSCSGALVCNESICIAPCGTGEISECPAGASCTTTAKGKLCVPQSCTTGGCPAGGVCSGGVCVPACDGVKCPGTQVCQDGKCIDPCVGVTCSTGQSCVGGKCVSPCSCYAGNLGCSGALTCDPVTTTCTTSACAGKTCSTGKTCDNATGACVSFCDPSVKCPVGQKCVAPTGCVDVCAGVTCGTGLTCNATTGACEDHRCDTVTCFAPAVCVAGACVVGDGGVGDGGGDGGDASDDTGMGGGDGSLDGGDDASDGGGGGAATTSNGGCGCTTSGTGGGLTAVVGAIGLALAIASRRRR